MAAYALTIFTGAFLLFQVQPLIGKYILPWFGGGPGVWTTCMLFFQMLLLGGYAYAHFTSRWLKPRTQAVVHMVLLAVALALLPITPNDSWKPHGAGDPTLQILALLAVSLGLPYFVLSATGPLVQQWFSRARPGVSPYRLYALSNLGSLLALVSYPFFFETHFTRKIQAALWAWGLVAYVLCCGFCAIRAWKAGEPGRAAKPEGRDPKAEGAPPSAIPSSKFEVQGSKFEVPPSPPSTFSYLLWLLLPACASVLLLATTNKLCQDVAVIPFLWVAPLALYLLSFIICFDSPRWYARFPFTLALIAALGGLCWACLKRQRAAHLQTGRPLLRRALCLLHGLSRGALPAQARPALSDRVLPHDRRRRGAGRALRGHRRAALVHRLLRAAVRAVSVRAAVPAGLRHRPAYVPYPAGPALALDGLRADDPDVRQPGPAIGVAAPAGQNRPHELLHRPAHRDVDARGAAGGVLAGAQEVQGLPLLALPGVHVAVPGLAGAGPNPVDPGQRGQRRPGLPLAQLLRRAHRV